MSGTAWTAPFLRPPRVSPAACGIFHYRRYVGELSTGGCPVDFFHSHLLRTTARSLGIVSGQAVNDSYGGSGVTGYVVPPRSVETLVDQFETLRTDAALRRTTAENPLFLAIQDHLARVRRPTRPDVQSGRWRSVIPGSPPPPDHDPTMIQL